MFALMHRCIGALVQWRIDALVHRRIGALVHRRIGALAHWCIDAHAYTQRWSVVEDCCLKFNRTIGHGEDAFF